MRLDEIVNQIEGTEEKDDNSIEKLASVVYEKAMEKVAKNQPEKVDTGRVPKAELSPAEMQEKSTKDISAKELENVISGLKEEEKEEKEKAAAIEKISHFQQEKIASISDLFNENGNPAKAELFTKIASAVLATNPRVVVDYNFQQYQTLDGQPKEPTMIQPDSGEVVNNFY